MEYWKVKDEWFNLDELIVSRKEIWYGLRFMEFFYFWDSNKEIFFFVVCLYCGSIFFVDFIQIYDNGIGEFFFVICSECFDEVKIFVKIMKGCLLN